jgi:hypothetical protein
VTPSELRHDDKWTACGIAAVLLIVGVIFAFLSGCSALRAAAPGLLDATDAALRTELNRADGERERAILDGLELVAQTRRAVAEATAARASADAQATAAQLAAGDAAERASDEERAAQEIALAYAAAAQASQRAADAQARARDAQTRVTALEALVRALMMERVDVDAGTEGG